jgi:phosphatidylserine decarboxylase
VTLEPTPVRYRDRRTGEVHVETIFGEAWLRRLYETGWGRALLPVVASRTFSRIYGWLQDRPASRRRIPAFVEALDIDIDECELALEEYATFNEFFSRRLRPGARPLDRDPDVLVSPADGRCLVWPRIDGDTLIPLKGRRWRLAERYTDGSIVSLRLCPADYHRFHFPAAGIPATPAELGGRLYSVNPIAIAAGLPVFTANHRFVVAHETERFGTLQLVPVGATCVGTIELTAAAGAPVAAGDEMGAFRFGGSSLLVVSRAGLIEWDEDLVATSATGLETLVRMGESLGRVSARSG